MPKKNRKQGLAGLAGRRYDPGTKRAAGAEAGTFAGVGAGRREREAGAGSGKPGREMSVCDIP